MKESLSPVIPPSTIPDFLSKGQLREMCLTAHGIPISYRTMRKFIGGQLAEVVGYDTSRLFYGDHVVFLLQRLMPRKYGRLEENERWKEITSCLQ